MDVAVPADRTSRTVEALARPTQTRSKSSRETPDTKDIDHRPRPATQSRFKLVSGTELPDGNTPHIRR